MQRKYCRHCSKEAVIRSRGLCFPCYANTEIRDLYPSTEGAMWWGIPDFTKRARQSRKPTDAPAGSEEKIAVLMKRASKGLALFHPNDRHPNADLKKTTARRSYLESYWRTRAKQATAGTMLPAEVPHSHDIH